MDPALLTPHEQTEQFLTLLWADAPDEHYFYVWTLPDKKTYWFNPTPEGLQKAAEYIGRIRENKQIYVGTAVSDQQRGQHRRIVAAETSGIAGLWADIDFASPAHKKPGLPPSLEDAMALLDEALPPPTVLVHSGHGLQGWWLFDKPWIFSDVTERKVAQGLSISWNDTLAAVGKAHDWSVDSTYDLARVMRLPGSLNLKTTPHLPVQILSLDTAIRYSATSMREIAGAPTARDFTSGLAASPLDPQATSAFVLKAGAVPPFKKWEALKRADRNVVLTFERRRRDLSDQSASGWDMALANFCAIAQWSEQEIVDLLIYSRSEHGDNLKFDNAQYYARTIARARESAARAMANDGIGAVLEEIRQDPTPGADPEHHERSQQALLDWLTPIFRVGILRAERYTQDPSLYRLQTQHGWVVLGTAAEVLDQLKVRGKILEVTKTVVPRIKQDEWDKVAEAIVRAAVDVDMGPEPTTQGATHGWLRDYFEQNPLSEIEADESAILVKAPFHVSGEVYLTPRSFLTWLNRYDNERMTMKEIILRLKVFGAEPDKVSVQSGDKSTQRNVWRLPREKFDAIGLRIPGR